MIIETVMTSLDSKNDLNFSAIGVEFVKDKVIFYPYKNTTTAENILATKKGTVNIVDRSYYLILAALSEPEFAVDKTDLGNYYLKDCCYYYEFKLSAISDLGKKYKLTANITAQKSRNDFIGLNRAENLLLEAAIIASRIGITKKTKELKNYLAENREIIFKTGDQKSKESYLFLKKYLQIQEE
ncbi:DUF447 domain-containing protein [Halanaerobium hydrogeniformans]|uniref:DUF447 family protein n=1 Tax=Halanaerobium hydrogeniformans TaxID=656519 RepID=E4RM52_HALHG|nr:DUF447 domain-containing protein [Halanaerobium hydrogeniformans]ADQ14383.1 protein of unknown function DUF447 [Halanaerobium hydrogeniformans]